MNNPGLIKVAAAAGAIAAHRILAFAADDQVAQAAAATDALCAVSTELATDAGERCDMILSGVAEVTYGDAVSAGDLLTADAEGKAVPAAPAAGANVRTIGMAMVSGVAGDVGSVLIAPSQIQG